MTAARFPIRTRVTVLPEWRLLGHVVVVACALIAALAPAVPCAAGPPSPAAPTAPQANTAATGGAPTTPTPTSIPVPQIVTKAAEVTKMLRDLDTLAAPQPAILEIQNRLRDVSARLGPEFKSTIEILEQGPPIGIQERLTQSWQASSSELLGWQELVTKRATRLERELDGLEALRATWTLTRTNAQASRAPTPVMQNVEAVIADLGASSMRLQGQRAVTLVLQDQVAEEVKRCQEALAQISLLRQGGLALTFTPSAPPIWKRDLHGIDVDRLPARLSDELGASIALIRQFAAEHSVRLVFHGLLIIGLVLVTRAGRRWAHALAATEGGAPAAAGVFEYPYSAAAVAGLVSVFWIYPSRPRTVGDLTGILMLLPLLRLLRPLTTPAMRPALYAFAGLITVDRVRAQLVMTALGDQVLLLIEMLAAMAILAWLLGSPRLTRALTADGATERRLRAQRVGAGIALVVCTASFATAAQGVVRFGRFLGSGLLVDIFLALAAYGAVKVGEGLIVFVLRTWPLHRLGMVARHGDVLEPRIHRAVNIVMAGTWALAILNHRGLLDPAARVGRTIMAAELRRGEIAISVGDVVAFALTVWFAFVASRLIRFVLEEDVFPHLRLERGLPYTISSLLHYAILVLGFLLGIAALGVNLNKVTILAGAFGVGLGFGLQGVVNNFVSGLIVLLERPMHVGDTIQMGDITGQVRRIGSRSTTVQTAQGAEVIVPNANLVAEKVTNWTLSSHLRRIDVPIGVAYGTPPEKVLELLRNVATASPNLLATPAPEALFVEFADSALKFELRAWTDEFDRWLTVKSDLNVAVYAALQGAGIEIPFPQREIRLRQQ